MNIHQLRTQIAALQSATMDENKHFRSAYDEGKFDALEAVDALLDSMQKEPKEIDFEKELHKYFGQVHDFTLCVNIAKKFYDKGYFDGHIHDGDEIVHVDGRRVNVSRFRRVAKPLEEFVRDDLERAANEYVLNIRKGYPRVMDKTDRYIKNAFKAGSQWQK